MGKVMQTEQNNEEEDLSKYYHLETEDDKKAFENKREDYFGEVSALLPRVAAAKSKLNEIQAALRVKVQQLEAELKKRAKENAANAANAAKANQQSLPKTSISEKGGDKQEASEEDLLKQDLEFCKLGLVEGVQIGSKMDKDKLDLENILVTREKKSYNVITDIALNPLPSDRAKDKNKSKDKDNKNDGNQDNKANDKDKNADKQATQFDEKDTPKKLSAADLKKLRNGQSLDSKETPKAAAKTHAPQQNINMGMMLRQQGGSSLI